MIKIETNFKKSIFSLIPSKEDLSSDFNTIIKKSNEEKKKPFFDCIAIIPKPIDKIFLNFIEKNKIKIKSIQSNKQNTFFEL